MGGADIADAYHSGRPVLTALERVAPLGAEYGTEDLIPEIQMSTQLHRIVDKASAALSANRDVYQCGGKLVHVVRADAPIKRVHLDAGRPRISPIPLPTLLEMLTRCARWTKVVDGFLKPCLPSKDVVAALASRGRWQGIRHLEGIVESPVLRPDGTVLSKPGYDAATGLLFISGTDFGHVSERPSRGDAERARDELLEVVADFPFVTRSHAMA